MTPTAIINAALEDLGVIAPGDTPASTDSTLGLNHLNRILSQWATRKIYAFYDSIASYTLGVSQQSYTIGPSGATFTATRPVKILRANILLTSSTPNVRVRLAIINTDDYASLGIPALSATFPSRLYYQPTLSKGTIWLHPYPTDTSNKLELFTMNQLGQIAGADVGTDYPLPPGYDDALIRSLVESIALPFGVNVSEDYKMQTRRACASIAALNMEQPKMQTDLLNSGLRGGTNFWRTGGY